MTHTYKITGMTCKGCAAKVKDLLAGVSGVTQVDMNLEGQSADITTNTHILTSDFQKTLEGTKYSIADFGNIHKAGLMEQASVETPVTFTTYLPLLLIFGYITGVTLLLQGIQVRFNLTQWMGHFMAGFFLVFSFFKMLDIRGFAMSYSTYDIVAKRWAGYGYIYPFIELALGISFLFPAFHNYSNFATLVVMSISIVGVIQSVFSKRKIKCACLGAVFNLPMSTVTIIEDAIMIVMSALALMLV